MEHQIEVRIMQKEDIPKLAAYWSGASDEQLHAMGADPQKMFSPESFIAKLQQQLQTPHHQKQAFATIWLIDGQACGHSNVDKIKYGEEAYMHLHLWKAPFRKKGMGTELVKKSLGLFFEHLKLQTVWSEPYALNPAPNRVLEKLGFEFVKRYVTTPGAITFKQEVNRWEMSKSRFTSLVSNAE